MKKTINKKNWFRIRASFFVAALIVASFMLQFLIGVGGYTLHSFNISLIESDAENGYWTANGFVTWTDSQVESYNEAVSNKQAYLETSDVANFLYHCGFSVTGKIFRLVAIVAAAFLLVSSLAFAFQLGKSLINYALFKAQKAVRRPRRGYAY